MTSSRKLGIAGTLCAVALVGMGCLACGARSPQRAESAVAYESRAMPFAADREQYEHIAEHGFVDARTEPLSTFAIDVDTASYSNVRRFITDGALPPADAVRIEELDNYFDYGYPAPAGDAPLALYTELGDCPWNPNHKLLQVGMRARDLSGGRAPARNLVFLMDVSGSMSDEDKLPLLKRAFMPLIESLRPEDKVAIVVYAGSEGLVLPPTSGTQRGTIRKALENLDAGGSTNGGAGIELAYRMARESFVSGGVNRVILATDGDFNVGVTSQGELVRMIERERASGVFLTVLGFGSGNLQDHTMESLADHGNGNYAYIDSLREAEKVLVREAASTLVTVAKDVKIQVELNPAQVASYRLVGYENRALAAQDFADDRKDAGELGAGDTVTALYEIQLAQAGETAAGIPLRYQALGVLTPAAHQAELATVAVRYQAPEGGQSTRLELSVAAQPARIEQTSPNFRFAAAVASFGMWLRQSPHAGSASPERAKELAASTLGADLHGDRRELLALIDRARSLKRAE